MADPKTTTPVETDKQGLPIRTLQVTVVEGPDRDVSHTATGERLSIGTADGNDVVLSDPTVSRYHVELTREGKAIRIRDLESTNGTAVGPVRVRDGLVLAGTTLQLGRTKVAIQDAGSVTVELHPENALGSLRGASKPMRRLMAQIAKAAQSDVPVLLVGESGTGKELIADALHRLGPRAQAPFEIVDCASLAPALIASQLFGHERGAFTGADREHVGAFERAQGGTLFLDELGELPADLQPVLLGALERRRFRRVGGTRELEVDVRLVVATNRDLRAEINAGRFRLDLFYRVATVTLLVPALRDRTEDIPVLIEHFLRECGHEGPVDEIFPTASLAALAQYRFPGNVRELRNIVEATIAMGEAPTLPEVAAQAGSSDSTTIQMAPYLTRPYRIARSSVLRDFEARYTAKLLERHGDNVSRAARAAQMDRSYLFTLLSRHNLR